MTMGASSGHRERERARERRGKASNHALESQSVGEREEEKNNCLVDVTSALPNESSPPANRGCV